MKWIAMTGVVRMMMIVIVLMKMNKSLHTHQQTTVVTGTL
jgi:hypothetical protein